jgi:hypothetical protein
MCARCSKPVDHVAQSYDMIRDCYIFAARCHGETETSEVPADVLSDIDIAVSFSGYAFSAPDLLPRTA